ncbi:MAG: GTP-binding protein [Paludibacteraceae bacterium]|nr:GTP-binding protein [Paludibacteraceae bacterium]
MQNNIPILLITGYLGSGKTTLLNRILTNEKGIRFAVIVNDIGEVNIDASLIQQGGVVSQNDDSLVALQNGCICCSLKMDLLQQLHDLCAQKAFDYIVIEASGICEPAPIAQTICSYREMVPVDNNPLPVLDCICSVVDALRLRDEFSDQLSVFSNRDSGFKYVPKEEDLAALVIEQIEFSNIILLNKASEVSEDELAHIRSIIRAIQPTAEIIETNYCDVDFDKILHTGMFDFDRTATSAKWIQEVEDAHHHEHHHDDEVSPDETGETLDGKGHHHHDHDHEGHDHLAEFGIDTYVYFARKPFDLGMFDEFVASHWPKNVLRCKGMCYFAEEYDMCYLFEQAGRQFNLRRAGEWFATMPKEELMQLMADDAQLRKDWNEQYGDRMQKLVFIGQHLDTQALKTALDNCLQ